VQAKTRELSEALQQQTATAEVLKGHQPFRVRSAEGARHSFGIGSSFCEADIVVIHRSVGDSFRGAASFGLAEEHHRAVMDIDHKPGRGSLGARVLFENAPVLIDDAESDPEYTFWLLPALDRHAKHAGCAPDARGCGDRSAADFPQASAAFHQAPCRPCHDLADQAVIAIENVRLFDEVQARTEDLRESLQFQTATSEVLQVISSSPGELVPVFATMLENATRVCGAEFGSMSLIEDGWVRQAALYNAPPHLPQPGPTRSISPTREAPWRRQSRASRWSTSPMYGPLPHTWKVPSQRSSWPSSAALARSSLCRCYGTTKSLA